MVTFILTFIFISLLILVHELGHFFTALMFRIRVDEFGFGFPPRLFSIMRKGIRYSINALPFGGFVKIFGEQGEGEDSPDSFISRAPWQRFIVLFAGIAMNFVLAWVFFSSSAFVGVPQPAGEHDTTVPVSIIEVVEGSPAQKAGLRFGDAILELRRAGDLNFRIQTEKDVQDFFSAYRGEEITMVIRRGKDVSEVHLTPRVNPPPGQGAIGIAMARVKTEAVAWYQAPVEGFKTLLETTQLTLEGFWTLVKELVVHRQAPAGLAGPIGIFQVARDTRSLGLSYFLQFIGILSVNLAILNFLPIPALDGGRIFFLLIEKIRGKRVSQHAEAMAHTIGFFVLVGLMLLVTYHDIVKFF